MVWKIIKNEKGRKNYTRLRNELKSATEKAQKEYPDSICEHITELQRKRCYNLMYMETKQPGWKENHGSQNIGIKYTQGDITIDQRQYQQFDRSILQSYMTQLIDQKI
jgi:hypothetical protein